MGLDNEESKSYTSTKCRITLAISSSPFHLFFFASRSEKGRSLVFGLHGRSWRSPRPLYHYVIFYQNNKTSREEEEGFLVLGAIWKGSLWHHFCHKEQG